MNRLLILSIAHLNPDDVVNEHDKINLEIRDLLKLSKTTLKQVSMGLYP
jgi:hypothetical protein